MYRTVIVFLLAAMPLMAESIDFESGRLGKLPSGWSAAMTSNGAPPRWEVTQDNSASRGAKALVQVNGGTIEVQSRIGEGSRFRLRLPLAKEESEAETLKGAST